MPSPRSVQQLLVEIERDYARAEQAAAAPKVSTREPTGDRTSDPKSDMATRALEIAMFHEAYMKVKRGRHQAIQIRVVSRLTKEELV